MKNHHPLYPWALLIIAVAAYLAFAGLGNNYFWDDEAGTAIFARNLLDFGKLTAWDGRNLAAYRNGSELDGAFINRFFPPLQFVLVAAAFRIFGFSTIVARLPFVLAGLLSLPFYFSWLNQAPGRNPTLSLTGLLLLALSPSFLLFSRQCRYFSLAIFFPVIIYFFYRRYLSGGGIGDLTAAAAGFLGLFFSHYLIGAAFAFALLGVHSAFNLRTRKPAPFLIAGGVCLAVVLGYILGFRVILPESSTLTDTAWWLDRLTLLFWNLREINSYNLFPWLMLFPLAGFFGDSSLDRELQRRVREWLFLIALFALAVSLLSPQPVTAKGDADIRYLLPLLPFCAALLGATVFFLERKSKIAGGAVLLLLIFSNLLSLNPFYLLPLRFDLINYTREIHRDYQTAYEAVVAFIQEKCAQDDQLVVIPPNMSDSLQFYAGERVIFGGRLNRETHLPLERVRELNPGLLVEESRPDWIVSFRMRPITAELLEYYRLRGIGYDLFETLEVYFLGEAIRPEILLREFGEHKLFTPEERIFIFKRSEPGEGKGRGDPD